MGGVSGAGQVGGAFGQVEDLKPATASGTLVSDLGLGTPGDLRTKLLVVYSRSWGFWASLVSQMVKNLPAMREIQLNP